MDKKIALLLFSFLALPLVCSAHLPRLVVGQNPNLNNPIAIQQPEISQVFYGKLIGDDQYFSFNLPKQSKILLGLLIPIDEKDWPNLELIGREGKKEFLAGNFTKVYFENFSGDYYLQGPEQTYDLSAGGYVIKIRNSTDMGRYALVIGQTESFTVFETIKTYLTLPFVKERFFGKLIWENFVGLLGVLLILFSIALFQIKVKMRRWFLLSGLILFLISSIMIFANNPSNLIGWLKILLSVIATIVAIIANLKLWNNKKFTRDIQYGIWVIIVFLMICMF